MSLKTIKFKILSTNHILIEGYLNKVKARFIVDTGASNSCIDVNKSEKFDLSFKKIDETASSATGKIKETFLSEGNILKIGLWMKKNVSFILFDMKQINVLLNEEEKHGIDGIIGADIFIKNKGIINYNTKKISLAKT